jgi:hypothetical protein
MGITDIPSLVNVIHAVLHGANAGGPVGAILHVSPVVVEFSQRFVDFLLLLSPLLAAAKPGGYAVDDT